MDSFSLTSYQLVDLLLRFLSIGQLTFLIVFLTRKQLTQQMATASCFLLCLIGFLLLNSPTTDNESGVLRGVFLTATELVPYTLWLFAYSLVNDQFNIKILPKLIKAAAGFFFGWLVYFFGVQLGRGFFHQISNLIAIALVVHVVYLVIADWRDDLDDNRRKIRALLLSYIGFYAVVLVLVEMVDSSVKNSAVFGLSHSVFVLLSISLIGGVIIRNSGDSSLDQPAVEIDANTPEEQVNQQEEGEAKTSVPIIYQQTYLLLKKLMEDGYYTETGLTISALANELDVPEHQLRELINKHLGFRNFSSFLNSYRLPAAQQQLADMLNARTPILTIALNLGYGSIGPFNRAFKAKYQQTPSEFRQSFLK